MPGKLLHLIVIGALCVSHTAFAASTKKPRHTRTQIPLPILQRPTRPTGCHRRAANASSTRPGRPPY